MAENNDRLPQLHIVVDATKVTRCKWCGTTQSEQWIPTGYGDLYCSHICLKASRSEKMPFWVCLLILLVILTPVFALAYIFTPYNSKPFVGVPGLLCIVSLLYCIIYTYQEKDYSKEVPKNSRWNKGLSDLSLLETVATQIECPNCDGNIDLSKVKEDMVYHCDYCGASGLIEIVKMK